MKIVFDKYNFTCDHIFIDKLYTRDHMKIVFDKYNFTCDHIFIDKYILVIIFLLINI